MRPTLAAIFLLGVALCCIGTPPAFAQGVDRAQCPDPMRSNGRKCVCPDPRDEYVRALRTCKPPCPTGFPRNDDGQCKNRDSGKRETREECWASCDRTFNYSKLPIPNGRCRDDCNK